MAGGTPANPATLRNEREPDCSLSSSVRLRRRLCSPSRDGITYELVSPSIAWEHLYKVMAGGTPANPATLRNEREPDCSLSSSVRLRRRLCSPSRDGITYELVSPSIAWEHLYKVMAGGTPANPATLRNEREPDC